MNGQRIWTSVGDEYIGVVTLEDGRILTRELVEAAIDDLDWIDVATETMLPTMMVLGIQETITQLGIPKVDLIAYETKTFSEDDGGIIVHSLAPYGFYGIQGHYKNGRARVYVLDAGAHCTPLCSDFFGPACDHCGKAVYVEVDGYYRHGSTHDSHCTPGFEHECGGIPELCGPWATVDGSHEAPEQEKHG